MCHRIARPALWLMLLFAALAVGIPSVSAAHDGNDNLNGDSGDDKLVAGNGDDFIDGRAGDDFCSDDAGTDTTFNCEVGAAVKSSDP